MICWHFWVLVHSHITHKQLILTYHQTLVMIPKNLTVLMVLTITACWWLTASLRCSALHFLNIIFYGLMRKLSFILNHLRVCLWIHLLLWKNCWVTVWKHVWIFICPFIVIRGRVLLELSAFTFVLTEIIGTQLWKITFLKNYEFELSTLFNRSEIINVAKV